MDPMERKPPPYEEGPRTRADVMTRADGPEKRKHDSTSCTQPKNMNTFLHRNYYSYQNSIFTNQFYIYNDGKNNF